MGPPVTPSPTPPADGLLVLSPSPQGARGIFGAQLPGMDSLKSRQWRYSTPPFDDRPSYGQASLVPAAQASSVSASIPRLADSRTPPSPIAFHHRLNLDDMKRNLFSPSPAGLMAQPVSMYATRKSLQLTFPLSSGMRRISTVPRPRSSVPQWAATAEVAPTDRGRSPKHTILGRRNLWSLPRKVPRRGKDEPNSRCQN